MAEKLIELIHSVQIVDPATGRASKDFLQLLNTIIRTLRDHETRITDLEP